MAEERIGANTQQSIEAIVLLDSGETKLHFQTSCSAIVYACASACDLRLTTTLGFLQHGTGHPVMQAFKSGDWKWCYVDQVYV